MKRLDFMLDKIPLLLYSIPLIISFSLVYQGTRNEEMSLILPNSLRTMLTVGFFMVIIMILLGLFSL